VSGPEPDHYLPDARLEIEKVITLLRLFKEGICGFNLIVQAYSQEEPYSYSANTLLHYIPYTLKPEPRFELNVNEAEIEGFKAFFCEYDTPAYTQLSLAMEYFNKSYIEPCLPRDSLLDSVVALEFLLLKGTKDELAYRLSIRAAFLLGSSADERKEIYQSVKKAYNLLSKVIHGEGCGGKLTHDLMLQIRDYTRRALKIFLKDPLLRDKLDDTVLSRLS
jgi:hypothetical protein